MSEQMSEQASLEQGSGDQTEPILPTQGEPTLPPVEREPFSFWNEPPPSPPRRERRRGRILAPFLAALLGTGAGTGATWYLLEERDQAQGVVRVAPPVASPGVPQSGSASLVAQAVLPSIVNISVRTVGGQGNGSGVIYRSDGYILTNNHVVESADSIQVTLATGETLDAAVVGTAAPAVDIALVKVAKDALPAATMGSSAALKIGDLAVALGSPFGLQGTVTAGVISALHRSINLGSGVALTDAIQTDAPINPGNSGGALANERGEIVGINTAILGGTGGNVGVGFAIPIDMARKVADQIIETGRARLAFLGVSSVTLPDGRGAQVREIIPGGPAQAAGLQVGDVIVAFGGAKIESTEQLIEKILARDVGEKVTVEVLRGGERKSVEVTLAERPGEPR